MSFLDPVFDVFADLGDSIGDFAESDVGKLALIAGAAWLTGGASLGASGAGAAGAGTAGAAGAGAGVAGASTAGTTAAAIEAAEASQLLGLTNAGTAGAGTAGAGIASITPPPIDPSALTTTGIPSVPDIGTSNVTNLVQGSPYSSGTQIADLTSKGSVTFDAAGAPTYTSGTLPSGGPAPTNYLTRPDVTAADKFGGITGTNTNLSYASPTVNSTGISTTTTGQGLAGVSPTGAPINPTTAMVAEPSAFSQGLSAFGDYAATNPYRTAFGTYLGASALGLLDPKDAPAQEKYSGSLSRYKMSPNFQPSNAQPNVYKPTYAAAGGIMQAGGPVEQMSMNAIGGNTGYPQSGLPYSGYSSPTASPIPQNVVQGDAGDVGVNPQTGQERFAQGGIAHFRRGGNLSDAMDFYKSMSTSKASPAPDRIDPGIYYDMDPDTRYQDALTAAQIRQAKVNKRAYVTPPAAKRPTPMGQLNLRPPGAQEAAAGSSLDPENAAQGGIMRSSLGGYAAGGNPRLLKGPGDGMSDNIPATIAGKQPARLADGEFVIPADVVSHLGNGSTEAGAKRLHEMMNKIRKARTGNSKQGKQINPNKFMPA
jgi:hypothetical protein